MRRWRKMTWVLIAWCVLIVVWAITSANSASSNCSAGQKTCDAAGGIALLAVLLIGFFGFVFLALIWFMTRPGKPSGQPPAASPPEVAAGWYPDPWRHATQRWWDGYRWTEHVT